MTEEILNGKFYFLCMGTGRFLSCLYGKNQPGQFLATVLIFKNDNDAYNLHRNLQIITLNVDLIFFRSNDQFPTHGEACTMKITLYFCLYLKE